jgi:hypothetical protein
MISFEMLSLFVYTGHWVIGIPYQCQKYMVTTRLIGVLTAFYKYIVVVFCL